MGRRPCVVVWLCLIITAARALSVQAPKPHGRSFWPRSSPLERLRLSVTYRHHLTRGAQALQSWCVHSGVVFSAALSHEQMDLLLLGFVHFCWTGQLPFYIARAAVLQVQTWAPRYRWKLPRVWNALKSWKRLKPSIPRTPLPLDLVPVLFLRALELARAEATRAEGWPWLSLAVLIRTGFFGLLRPGEITKLKRRDVQIVLKSGSPPLALIALRDPKTSYVEGAGAHQFVCIREVATVQWLAYFVAGLKPEEPLWPRAKEVFTRFFKQLLIIAGLRHLKLTPACLRAGGTTHLFISGQSLEQISFLGRWTTLSTLRSYIQEGAAELIWNSLALDKQCELQAFVSRYRTVWLAPPSLPARQWWA